MLRKALMRRSEGRRSRHEELVLNNYHNKSRIFYQILEECNGQIDIIYLFIITFGHFPNPNTKIIISNNGNDVNSNSFQNSKIPTSCC
jgi:hypothetical protein